MKHTFYRFFSVLFVLTLCLHFVYAERISQEDAATVANNFMNAGTTQSGVRKSIGKRLVLKTTTTSDEQPQYYVYEYPEGGWVMIAANDAAHPIMAYSKTGQFNMDNQPKNVKRWLIGYEKQIQYAEQNNIEATEEVAEEWKALRTAPPVTPQGNVVVAPLIKTTWDQDSPYWNSCPKISGTNTLTGCVATAMAQVMNYWQWPETGVGSASVTVSGSTYTANFGETTYDWANRVDHYTTYYTGTTTHSVSTPTTAQKNAVATLMYHCGVAAEMEYGTSVSGAYTIYPNASATTTRCAQYALKNNFRYKSSTLKGYQRKSGYGYSGVSDANWHNYLKTELDAARPIMYAGADSEGGHSFICDGYDDQNYYHFNWGWSGYCDGYYTVDNMVPGTGGSGAGNGSYNDDQDIIIGIIPDKPDITITWSVQGITSTTTQTSGTLVLPASTPSDCSGSGGKKFVGWTAQSSVSGSAPADLFKSGSGITVTENKTYYAVYATASGSGGTSIPVTKTMNTFAAISGNVDSDENISFAAAQGTAGTAPAVNNGEIRIYQNGGTLTITANNSKKITDITIGSSMNTSVTYSIDGSSTSSSQNISANGTLPLTDLNASSILFTCTGTDKNHRLYLNYLSVTYSTNSGGTSYSNYSLVCGTPCSNTPVMSFSEPTTVAKTTADASFTKAVTITGKGSGQTVSYSSSDETIATVNNSGIVTLKGKVGSTTISASVEANGTYCAASASYTLNVTAAPINITLYYNGTSATLNNQTNPYTLPTGSPYNTAMCNGDWAFAGWYGSAYTKSETAPSYITELTSTGSAYAVYTMTENSGGGASIPVTKTMSTFAAISGNVDSDENISFAAAQGTASTAPAVNNGEIRIYQNGGTLTITANNSKKITDITIGSSMVTSVTYSIDGGTTSSNQDISAGGTLALSDLDASSILFTCTGTDKNHRLYLNYLSVTYSGEGGGSSTTYYATSPDCAAPADYTVTWKACGETFHTQGFADGAALVLPASTPADNAGKTFVGWTATEHHTGASAPADLFTTAGSKTVTANVTYYAVFH